MILFFFSRVSIFFSSLLLCPFNICIFTFFYSHSLDAAFSKLFNSHLFYLCRFLFLLSYHFFFLIFLSYDHLILFSNIIFTCFFPPWISFYLTISFLWLWKLLYICRSRRSTQLSADAKCSFGIRGAVHHDLFLRAQGNGMWVCECLCVSVIILPRLLEHWLRFECVCVCVNNHIAAFIWTLALIVYVCAWVRVCGGQ